MSASEKTEQVVNIPLELLRKLAPEAEKLGISLPETSRFAPTIDITKNIRHVAWELGRLLASKNLFLLNDDVVTVDEETGEVKPMTGLRLPSWAEEHCAFIAPGARVKRSSLDASDAAQILKTDVFRGCLKKVSAVHDVRLPVLRSDGKIELLPPGYDDESQIFTVEALSYDLDWTVPQAKEWLELHGKGYPWSQPDDQPNQELQWNRNWAVHVAAMVGTYCRAMFDPGTTRPMILYVANQPGTGKSTLAAMSLIPVFGLCAMTKTPKDDAEMDKELETAAQCRSPYLFFDDIGNGIFSNPLNRFITAPQHAGRQMGGNSAQFRAPAVTQVFATGNSLKLSDDLKRRSLISVLFLPGDVRGRKFDIRINPKYLARPDVRRKFLSALWALVANYAEMVPVDQRVSFGSLESFEEWTEIVSGIVQAAVYQDPLLPPVFDAGGTEEEDEMRELLIKLASEADKDQIYERKQIVEKARAFELLEHIVGIKDDKELDSSSNKRLGRQLQKWRGRELVDEKGRRFRFGHRRKKSGATYPLAFIK